MLGEIHFLKNAVLEGALRFRKASAGGAGSSQHRCVDVEGNLDFVDPDVEFIDCGSALAELVLVFRNVRSDF